MKAKVIRDYIDKHSMEPVSRGAEIDITEERFSELTTGPLGIFVEEIKEEQPEETYKNKMPPKTEDAESKVADFEKMTKEELLKYAASKGVDLNAKATKKEMIENFLQK